MQRGEGIELAGEEHPRDHVDPRREVV